jgi:uncharacterized protein
MMSATDARKLFLGAQGLLHDPERRATSHEVLRTIERLGFVQVDSIQVVERAHHLILHSRLDGYRPDHLRVLLERDRSVFEHWTHDASILPTAWLPRWKHRFTHDRGRILASAWWRQRLGDDAERVLRRTKARIAKEGPLRSQDFERPDKRGTWWDWTPAKAALDYLWRTGELAIVKREGFQKVYDLTERVFPEHHGLAAPAREAYVEWACKAGAERLVVFTPTELARFWGGVEPAEARAWSEAEVTRGALEKVLVASAGALPPVKAFAVHDWNKRLERLPEAPDRLRLLAPFDPIVRDRQRALRRFDFDYRFEAFVPPAKRSFGYFTMPILERDRLVGRADVKNHTARAVLEVKALAWEKGVLATRRRARTLEEGLLRLAALTGARTLEGARS